MRILVVEDDLAARKLLRFVLEQVGGHTVLEAADGRQGIELAPESDLVITDLVMPDADGFTLCRTLRAKSTVPIMAISASRTLVADRVRALRNGADDYLAKPFEPAEMLARIEALSRRSRMTPHLDEPGVVRVGDLVLDLLRQTVVTQGGPPVALTPTETRILARLARSSGQVVSRAELQQALWGNADRDTEKTLATYIVGLRRKIEVDPKRPRRLQTVRQSGYRLT